MVVAQLPAIPWIGIRLSYHWTSLRRHLHNHCWSICQAWLHQVVRQLYLYPDRATNHAEVRNNTHWLHHVLTQLQSLSGYCPPDTDTPTPQRNLIIRQYTPDRTYLFDVHEAGHVHDAGHVAVQLKHLLLIQQYPLTFLTQRQTQDLIDVGLAGLHLQWARGVGHVPQRIDTTTYHYPLIQHPLNLNQPHLFNRYHLETQESFDVRLAGLHLQQSQGVGHVLQRICGTIQHHHLNQWCHTT